MDMPPVFALDCNEEAQGATRKNALFQVVLHTWEVVAHKPIAASKELFYLWDTRTI